MAAKYGHSESVQLLLAAKGNVNAENEVNASLLHTSCKYDLVVRC